MSFWDDFKENVLDKSDAVKRFLLFMQVLLFVLSGLALIIYTLFTIRSLRNNWNSPMLNYIIIGFLVGCVILFVVLVSLNFSVKNSAKAQLKNYRLTLGGIRLALMTLNFILTVFVLMSSIFAGDANGGQVLALIVSASLLVFQVFFLIWRIRRARRKHLAIRQEKGKEIHYYDMKKK